MKNIVLLVIMALLISCSSNLFAQDRKEKKAKKRKNQRIEVPISNKEALPTPVQKEPLLEKTPANIEVEKPDRKPITAERVPNKPIVSINQIIEQSQPIVEQKPNGSINWTEQYIEAKGQSVIDNEKFKNPAQAKLMAQRGAVVVAQRNLLEITQGVNVTSETKVKDMITESDYIYTRVDGIIKNAQQVGEAVEKEGYIEVTMRISIYSNSGLAPAIYENVPGKRIMSAGAIAEDISYEDIGGAEGLVFNFNGKEIDPSMFPIVVDENGKMLFDFYQLYDPKQGNFPKILKQSREAFEQFGFNKGIKVIDVAESFNGKIVLDDINSKKINWEKIGNFASQAGKVLKFALALI